MMYNNKLACAIKNNGKVLREEGDTVKLPFGCEYSILLKNLNSVRALVDVEIDGTKVSEGGFVVNPNESIDIERFVKDVDKGNRFKFIERTKQVENSRGIGVGDGLIRVSFKFEKVNQYNQDMYDLYRPILRYDVPQHTTIFPNTVTCSDKIEPKKSIFRSMNIPQNTANLQSSSQNVNVSTLSNNAEVNDVGITVPGSVSDQQFEFVSEFPTENEEYVMVLQLVGYADSKPVKRAVSTRDKLKCVTCGKVNKSSSKFCSVCGTSLVII